MSEWISISDKLPEEDCAVLVSGPHGVELVCFNYYHRCWDDAWGDDYYKDITYFTHWMPLPRPPKE